MLNSAQYDQLMMPILDRSERKDMIYLLVDKDFPMRSAADYSFPDVDVREDDEFFLFTADVPGME